MERKEVIAVLEALASGVDPATGATIPHDAFHNTNTVRTLFTAATLLKIETILPPKGRRQRTSLTAAGTPWTREEDSRLSSEHDAGMTIAQIALEHGRSSGAITSRLVKLGRIDPTTVKSRDRGARVAS